MSALELAAAIQAKKISVAEAVSKYIEAAERSELNAFLAIPKERALEQAKIVQAQIDAGEIKSPLAGLPIGIKDNIMTKDIPSTCASKTLEGFVPVYSAKVADKLEQAGMIIVGKLNLDEFAMGGSSETSYFGPVRNPWDMDRVSGGSSGGSAAAVAKGEIPLALASDTGGSIRQPCSFCGTTGIKPTYGAVSRYGAVTYASSMDQIGPIGQNINDCAAMLEIISGPDPKDSTCIIKEPFKFKTVGLCPTPRKGTSPLDPVCFRIGLPRNYFDAGIDDDVRAAVLAVAKEFEEAGAVVEEFDMALMEYTVPAYYIIACAETSSNLSRYDGLKYGYHAKADTLAEVYRLSRSEGFGIEVKRRIMLGSFVLSSGFYDEYYNKAIKARALIKENYNSLFERFDMILSPVAPTTAYKIGENIDDPMKMYMGDIYTVSVNMAGLPAVALPCGFDKSGLPIGFQLIGNAFSEGKLIEAAQVFQYRTDYHSFNKGGVLAL